MLQVRGHPLIFPCFLRCSAVHILLLVKCDSHFFSSASKLSRARILIRIANTHCEKAFTVQRTLGLLYDPSKTFASYIIIICADFHLNRWTFGANRVQVDADVKVLSEFLSYLQTDSVRGTTSISSLSPSQLPSPTRRKPFKNIVCCLRNAKIAIVYVSRLKSINHPLRLLVENEIFRLAVWANPSNEAKRGTDHVGTSERNMLEVGSSSYQISVALIYSTFFRVLGRRWFALYKKLILPSQCTWRSDSKVLEFSLKSGSWFAQAR
jgi:hypothetical protein